MVPAAAAQLSGSAERQKFKRERETERSVIFAEIAFVCKQIHDRSVVRRSPHKRTVPGSIPGGAESYLQKSKFLFFGVGYTDFKCCLQVEV